MTKKPEAIPRVEEPEEEEDASDSETTQQPNPEDEPPVTPPIMEDEGDYHDDAEASEYDASPRRRSRSPDPRPQPPSGGANPRDKAPIMDDDADSPPFGPHLRRQDSEASEFNDDEETPEERANRLAEEADQGLRGRALPRQRRPRRAPSPPRAGPLVRKGESNATEANDDDPETEEERVAREAEAAKEEQRRAEWSRQREEERAAKKRRREEDKEERRAKEQRFETHLCLYCERPHLSALRLNWTCCSAACWTAFFLFS